MTRRYRVTLTFTGPILTQSTTCETYGIDAPMARNRQGQFILAGSLVKGKLRQGLEELASLGLLTWPVDEILGHASGSQRAVDEQTVAPFRARLQFDDFVYQGCPPSNGPSNIGVRYRIRLDETLGSVTKGALLLMDAPFAAGEDATFEGGIRLMETSAQEAVDLLAVLDRGFRMVTGLGAERTVGFGRLKEVRIDLLDVPLKRAVAAKSAPCDEMFFDLRFSGPFCIAKGKADNNLFQSEEIVPGGVLKGALAATWLASLGRDPASSISGDAPASCKHKLLWKYFAEVRFSHAFPLADEKRFVYRPLSLTQYRDLARDYRDVLLLPHPALFENRNESGLREWSAPAFQVDWKHGENKVDIDFSGTQLKRELRVRTAIDREKRTAKDQQLFGMETIEPGDAPWSFRVVVPQIPDNERIALGEDLVELLSGGLEGLGKTKVSGNVGRTEDAPPLPAMAGSKPLATPGRFAVTLQTPALLCEPRGLIQSSREELYAAYQAYWDMASGHSLRLVRYFAAQRLAGGYYLHRRFRDGQPYRPWFLTTEGSVFLLETVNPGVAGEMIKEWRKFGLPPLDSGAVSANWQTCPYVRENGYGEILVDMAVHTDKVLGEAERYDLVKEVSHGVHMEV